MHIYTLNKWQHNHEFSTTDPMNEKRTLRVVILTFVMMILEIAGGSIFGSMALLADGWHMGTHAAALGITLFAYWYARRQASSPRYSFGTGKISVLGGFSSAIVLQVIAILMAIESVQRLFNPLPIQYTEAIIVAVIGLAVNLLSVRLLSAHHHHESHGGHLSDHHDDHRHDHHPTDHNLKAAYFHVLADALTSVLAIAALTAGRAFGWSWMDAMMGVVGGIVISRWAIGLLRETSHILLDGRVDNDLVNRIKTIVENDADSRLSDLHLWKIGDHSVAAILSLVTHFPRPVEHYRSLLSTVTELSHVTIEVNTCTDEPCLPFIQTARGKS
jgi:cation diffusion facilitator family transporter